MTKTAPMVPDHDVNFMIDAAASRDHPQQTVEARPDPPDRAPTNGSLRELALLQRVGGVGDALHAVLDAAGRVDQLVGVDAGGVGHPVLGALSQIRGLVLELVEQS